MSDLSNQAQKLLPGFYKTVHVMQSAYSKSDKMMSVWADDLYAVEAVMSFLETIRDAPAQGVAISDEQLEAAWAAIVGHDIAEHCFQCSIVRQDLRTALETLLHSVPSGQKIADIEILQQKLEFAEWEWNRATEGMKERDAKIALLESLVEGAITTFKAIYAKTPHPDIAAMAFDAIQTLSSTNSTADAGSDATPPQYSKEAK